jgi:hypothetical protein
MALMPAATAIALAGLATSAAGAGYSAYAQNQASNAQQRANDQAISAQNAGFWSRNASAKTQLDAQASAQETAQAAQKGAFDNLRSKQSAALDSRDTAVAAENQAADDIRARADAARATLLDNTTSTAMDTAQAADAANRTAMVAPVAQNVQETSALGSPGETTKQAYASRLHDAATKVRDYGQRLATVSSYTAPLTTVSQAISDEQAQLMPVAAANRLLQSGQSARILPSQTAYNIAGSEAGTQNDMIAAALKGDLNVAGTRFQGDNDVANLRQGNTTQISRNAAAEAESRAKQDQALGAIISSVGNIGAYGASRYPDQIDDFLGTGKFSKAAVLGGGSGAP